MIKVRQVKIEVTIDSEIERKKALLKKLKINESDLIDFEISKQSLDARDKDCIYHVYEFNVKLKNENIHFTNDILKYDKEEYKFLYPNKSDIKDNIVIIGAGPAGLFCAYILASNGYKVNVIERGKQVEERSKDVEKFWEEGVLNPNSNVQFGEGGAGCFSDGKLNTLVKDKFNRMQKVFEVFVECGAPKEILYSYKPHIGTDLLRKAIINMRNKIIALGGKFIYESTVTDIEIENNTIKSIIINDKDKIDCNKVVLAIGHSARDTFYMLYDKGLLMESKPFAVGLRVQHPQKVINESQYGHKYKDHLGSASYKLTYTSSFNRGVYSFCMCPGGFVVNSSSENGHLVVNGMSNHARDEENANSAIIVTVGPKDFGNSPLAGIKYQSVLEQKTYELGNGNIPIQLLGDYKKGVISSDFGMVKPIMKGKYAFANLNELFSNEINISLNEAFKYYGTKINGFDMPDAILAGVESRTSSPVKIIRDENFESSIKGLFPCGEGAGYAGGITSAAIDGIKVAEAVVQAFL